MSLRPMRFEVNFYCPAACISNDFLPKIRSNAQRPKGFLSGGVGFRGLGVLV